MTEKGRIIGQHIGRALKPVLERSHGHFALQLGIDGLPSWLDTLPIVHRFVVTPYESRFSGGLQSSLYELPIDTNAVDFVFAPFCLELLDHTDSFLHEINRVLKPNGTLLFCGVNPSSFWGVPGLLAKRSMFSVWQSGFYGASKLRRRLTHMGVQVEASGRFYYAPPCIKSERGVNIFEQIGKMILPYPAGFYWLEAKKVELMAIRPVWSYRNYVVGKPTMVS